MNGCPGDRESAQMVACHVPESRPDYLLWGSLILVCMLYGMHGLFNQTIAGMSLLAMLCHSVFELMNTIWWGILVGILMISLLDRIPREFVMSALGTRAGVHGILRATLAGVLLDLCSHGILMVGAKLYERGVSTGQVMAFLIASPWNSFSLTLILIALIGLSWSIAFILLSMLVAVITGMLFDKLVGSGMLRGNAHQYDLAADFQFWAEARRRIKDADFSARALMDTLIHGLKESRMVVRWILFGVLLAAGVRAALPADLFADYFGPTLLGLGLTLVSATLIEVCSEGSAPLAADLLTRARAPGNSFTFLMGGVATDYTEIMVLKDTTSSWRVALFLPLLTLPQVMLLAWVMNQV